MRDHGSITFQVLRFALLLQNLPLQPHNLHMLRDILEVDGCSWLLVILNAFDTYARKFLLWQAPTAVEGAFTTVMLLDHLENLHISAATSRLKQILLLVSRQVDDLIQ